MIRKILRDNEIINPLLRSALRFMQSVFKSFKWLTSRYRVYGTVRLNVLDVSFKIYTLADDHIATEIFYHQGYEADEFNLVKELTKNSHFFIDVGANTGIFSIYAATANPSLKVLSFEPHPSNFIRFKKNIFLNQLTNVAPFPLALGAEEKTIQFTVPADHSLSTTSSANENFTEHFHNMVYEKIKVNQSTLDIALQDHLITACDLLKIDVEYYELDVLRGAIKTLSEKRPMVLIEILQYDRLVKQFPEMKGKLNENHAMDILMLLLQFGYFPYSIENMGVRALHSELGEQTNRNFLFIPKKIDGDFLTFAAVREALINLNEGLSFQR